MPRLRGLGIAFGVGCGRSRPLVYNKALGKRALRSAQDDEIGS